MLDDFGPYDNPYMILKKIITQCKLSGFYLKNLFEDNNFVIVYK